MKNSIASIILSLSILSLASGCGGGSDFSTSEAPNESTGKSCDIEDEPQTCRGEGQCEGTQYCDADGIWGMCECEVFIDGSGGEQSGSTGGESTGGSGSSTSSGGSDNTGGTGGDPEVCVPETCEEIGARISGVQGHPACGIVTNNCGNEVNCENSCEYRQECGEKIWNEDSPGTKVTGITDIRNVYDKFESLSYPSVCGESCVNITEASYPKVCEVIGPEYIQAVLCEASVTPTESYGCVSVGFNVWCCTAPQYVSY